MTPVLLQIGVLWNEGRNTAEIARTLMLDEAFVYNRLSLARGAFKQQNQKQVDEGRWTKTDIDTFFRLYGEGHTFNEIAEIMQTRSPKQIRTFAWDRDCPANKGKGPES